MRGNISLRAVLVLSVAVAVLGLSAGPAQAQTVTIFSEDFESPVVSGYSQGTLPDDGYWIGASQGYRSNYWGLVNEDTGTFTDPVGAQAIAFRYTNSGVTTADGVIGDFEAGITYTVSFDAVMDGGLNSGTPYTLQLIAFADGAVRNDCRSTPSGSTMLKQVSGNATSDGLYKNVTFDFTADPVTYAAIIGQDIGIRFRGATTSAIIDNVLVTIPPGAFWDLNGTDLGCGSATPSGIWDGSAANWNPVADGTDTPIAWTPGKTATFSAGDDANGTYAVTVNGTQDIGGLRFLNGDVTLTPGTAGELRMTADSAVLVDSGLTATITTVISEDVAGLQLTKNGDGTLVLSGANTFTGGITVASGSLDLGGTSQAIGPVTVSAAAPSGDTVSNGSLTATSYAASNDSGAAVVSANLQGSGATMTKTGAGTLVLSGTNTYDGMTSINAGALVFGKQAAINGGLTSITPTNVTVESGAALGLAVGDSASGYFDSAAVGAVLSQMGTSTATTGMKPGAQLGLDTTNATGGTFTQSSVIADLSDGNSLGLAKLGEGQLILDAGNTYTGATTVYAGTLTAGAGQTGAFGATPSLAFGPDSAAMVQLNGNDISLSSLTSNGGTPVVENGAATDAVLTVNNSANIDYAGAVQDGTGGGTLGLVKDGGGTLTLGAGNTYSGGTVINGGMIANVKADSLGTGDITFTGDGAIRPNYGSHPVLDSSVTVNTGVTAKISLVNQYYGIYFNGALTGDGTLLVGDSSNGANTVGFNSAGNTFTGTIAFANKGGTLRVNSLADSANPIKFSHDYVSNRYSALELGGGDATPLAFNSRQIEWSGGHVKIINNNGTDANTITINTDLLVTVAGNRNLTLGGSNTGDNVIAGAITNGTSGAISLIKENGGTWALSGTNTYSGTTTLTAGTLSIGAGNNLGDGSATNTLVFDGGTLRITGTALAQMSDLTNGGTRGITYTGGKAVGLDVADAGHTFTVDQVLAQTTGGFIKNGPGAAVLNQTNTYTGATTINAGTLYVNGTHDASAGGNSSYSVTGALGGNGEITTSADAVTVNSGGKLSPGTEAAPGTLALNLGAAALNLGAAGVDNAGQFTFRLGAVSDQIVLGAGTYLALGEATDDDLSLDWSDFTFIPGAGLTEGIYALIDADTNATGGLSTGDGLLTGSIGSGVGALSIADGQDLILTVSGLSTPGDADRDGDVDAADYIALKTNMGQPTGATTADGDFDDDGDVDWDDLQILQGNYGAGSPGATGTIPEPATLGLLAFGAMAILRRRRRS